MGDLKSGSPEGTLQSFLDQNPSVEYVRLIFVDYSAVPRVRVLTRHFALCLAREERPVTVGSPIQTACLVTGLILLEEIITGMLRVIMCREGWEFRRKEKGRGENK